MLRLAVSLIVFVTAIAARSMCAADSFVAVGQPAVADSIAATGQLAEGDSIASTRQLAETDSVAAADLPFYRRGLIGKVYDYFQHTNDVRPEKKFDMSFIGGPHYSSEEGLGIGLAASGQYRAGNFDNKETPLSNVTLKLDVTTGQLYKIAAEGYHIFEGDRYRLNYDVYFYSFKDKWWGVGYGMNRQDSNECNYKRLQSRARLDFVFQLRPGVFLGPLGQFSYVNASDFGVERLVPQQRTRVFNLGLGATFLVDTRDIPTAASRGVCVRLDVLAHPRKMFNKYAFTMTELSASVYRQVWKGGVLAANAHTRLTWGNTPWCLLSTFGGSHTMRGYWEGRYRDKMEADVTVELRQHVWRRNGIALWVGAGQVFPRFSGFRLKNTLPNAGVGYRWEFKKGVNVRLDVGFGRSEKSFNFSLNEAF